MIASSATPQNCTFVVIDVAKLVHEVLVEPPTGRRQRWRIRNCQPDYEPLRDRLYAEMLGRIQETDLSVPYPLGGFLYYTRTEEGKQYPIHCRKAGDSGEEQVLLDVNALAEGEKFMSVGAFAVSDDGRLLAYSSDRTGFREYAPKVAERAWVRVNGIDSIALTKLDVLDGLAEVPVCVGYRTAQGTLHEFPADLRQLEGATPIYETMPGWTAIA